MRQTIVRTIRDQRGSKRNEGSRLEVRGFRSFDCGGYKTLLILTVAN